MTARADRRRGIRTHRKRQTHRRQRKRQTHRKRRGHHKRQRGGVNGEGYTYFNEAYAENMTAAARLEDPAQALAEERKSGFLSNYYTRFTDGLPQDNLDMDKEPKPTEVEIARTAARFAVKGITDRVKGFYYKGNWFANSEQALALEKAEYMNRKGIESKDPMAMRLIEKILTTYNPESVKIIGSTAKGLPAEDGLGNYRIIFTKDASDGTTIKEHGFDAYLKALFRDWAEDNVEIMYNIQMAKYKPVNGDDEMMRWLKATGNNILAEAAEDPYWGIGMSKADAIREIDADRGWTGANHLGDILMRVRAEL